MWQFLLIMLLPENLLRLGRTLFSFHGEKHGLVTKISAENHSLGFTSYLLKLHFILSLATIHIPQLAWVWDMGEAVHVEFPRPRPRPLPLGLLRGHGGQLRDKISTDPWSRGFPHSRTC